MRGCGIVGLCTVWLGCAACGGGGGDDDGQTLDCALLTSEANCWHTFLADIADCVPPEAEEGTLAADRTECSYASGHRVQFDPAAPTPWIGDDGGDTSYALYDGDALCLDWSESGTNIQIASATGSVAVTASASGTVAMTCPDGVRYVTDDYMGLLTDCGYDAFTRGFPSQVLLENPSGFGVELTHQEEQDVRVFWCHP